MQSCDTLVVKCKISKLQDGFGISRVASSFTEHCGQEHYILQLRNILYVVLFGFINLVSLYLGVFREFPRKVIPASAFSYLRFCCSLHVAHTY